ncbi:hypothetical protein LOTGIDRAFT_235969 [Lottia gigantea]|uniref:Uncharacterized protein n=1 Tax=Lottia gigantea TaxID=225164 RepID=V3ZLF0_LOTGI|nr:hypothetical protein LOTGIDRAFT_235969 [Lottia gigantea]ESO85122.1 hypothetical protein LOTGIDRAFT_235969 [Lottia gigantea]
MALKHASPSLGHPFASTNCCTIVVTAVAGDCDVMKCIADLQNVDYQNPKEACPVGKEAIKCMENVINTCAALGDNKESVQKPLDMAKENFKKACGDSAAGFIQAQSMFMLLPLAIIAAIYSRL